MILSDRSISARLGAGLEIHPLAAGALQPASVDLRLGPALLVTHADEVTVHDLRDDGPFRMERHHFILGATLEYLRLPDDLAGVLAGKSSLARLGLQIHAAGFVDPGWHGDLTLEIVTFSPRPVYLTLGMPIAQIAFEVLDQPAARPYGSPGLGSKYQGSRGPVLSRLAAVRGGPDRDAVSRVEEARPVPTASADLLDQGAGLSLDARAGGRRR